MYRMMSTAWKYLSLLEVVEDQEPEAVVEVALYTKSDIEYLQARKSMLWLAQEVKVTPAINSTTVHGVQAKTLGLEI